MKTITVHSGQNIYNLAEQYYGTRSITKLLQDNPQITDIDAVIPAGTKLNIIQFPDNADRVKAFEKAGITLSTGDDYVAGKLTPHLAGKAINCILVSSSGVVWVATNNSYIYSWNGETWTHHDNVGAMTAKTVMWLFEDVENEDIYAASTIGVIKYKIATDTWERLYDTVDGLPSNNCRWIGMASNGTFYVGTDTGLATTSDWVSYTNFTAADPDLPSNDIRHGHITTEDVVWLATDAGAVAFGFGVYDYAGGHLPADDVIAVFNDGNRTWISVSDKGVVIYDGLNFILHNDAGPNIINETAYCFSKDHLGNVMIGFDVQGGVSHIVTRNGFDWRIEISSDLIANLPISPMTAIAFDAIDNLWLGTSDSGVIFYERNNLM